MASLRPVLSPVLSEQLRPLTDPPVVSGGSFTPDASFFAGASGYAYDYKNFATMFQDNAGATPVTALGQTLGKLLDLSGNGNHRTQSDAGKRPLIVASGAQFDGVDDGLTGPVSTAAAGAWTHLVRLSIGASTIGLLVFGSNIDDAYFGVYQSGSGAPTSSPWTPLSGITVGGAAVADSRQDLQTALAGSMKTMVTKIASMTDAKWLSTVSVANYGSSFTAAVTISREILIQRNLTGADLTNAAAWVAA